MKLTAVMLGLWLVSVALAYEPVNSTGAPCNITRGIYCPPGPLLSTARWGYYGGDYAFTDEAALGGRRSLKVVTPSATGPGSGVSQTIQIRQEAPAPIKISGWSKAVDVADPVKDYRYSIYLDLTHTDGTPLHMQVAGFNGGTHDWEYSETVVTPEKPLKSAKVYVFLRGRTGTAYFDDIFVGPVGGPNLLQNAGFEPEDEHDFATRDRMYAFYADQNANAIHTYLSGAPSFWTGRDGQGNADVRRFLTDAKERGIGVWVTTGGTGMPGFKDADDPNFPMYACVNGAWGKSWTNSISLAAAYDFAGISMVPDEHNWTNQGLKDSYSTHADPRVAEFYKQLPAMCNCPDCAALYEKTYGEKLPKLDVAMRFPEPSLPYLRYLKQRYDSTTSWMTRNVAAVKQANPKIRADSLICVSPICSDMWWGTGVAWDRIGAESGIDFPTTDPYILLHNYLGDSTHWYVTETAAHLTGCTPKRQCGIVLEASRLRVTDRELDPVEVYGSALSAVSQGAKELAWWHYSHLTDESRTTDRSEVSRAAVSGIYGVLKEADPWLGGLRSPKLVATLHSRAADDFWRFYATPPDPKADPAAPVPITSDPRHAAVAQKDVLYTLFRRGIPVDLYYLESATEQQLADYKAIVVPFAFAISDGQAALLRKLAEGGKTVVIISQIGALDEMGVRRQTPALAELCGFSEPPADPLARLTRQVGRGRVVFLGSACGHGLPVHRDNQKRTRTERILPDPLNMAHVAILDQVLKQACGGAPWVLGEMTENDIEARVMRNAAGETVLTAINWENEPVQVELRAPGAKGPTFTGYRLGPDGKQSNSALKGRMTDGCLTFRLELKPQEACLWRGR